MTSASAAAQPPPQAAPGLKKIPPYWYPYTTMAKGRWLGREILEVVSTEFRDRSMEYYRYALESGVTTINGKVAKPDTIIRNGDRIENVVHRHEPPVTSKPVKIIHHDEKRDFIVVDKPGSIPVHASGRYFRNSLIEILQNDFGFKKVYTVNRLDRLTSGLMIIPLSSALASSLSQEFAAGTIQKEYVARCKGKFPDQEVVCEEPLLTVDRQMGLNIVHPEGKPAKTVFKLLHYDANTDTSVVQCKPLTGRSHQIRVHLQYLGHPIANDPVYSETRIWGGKLGRGGVDLTPSEERSAPIAPPQFQFDPESNPESLSGTLAPLQDVQAEERPKLLPRETGHDIGMGSPVPLSSEAVGIITRLRNMKDEDEDWSRWRDVVFRAKGALHPLGYKSVPLPPQNKRKRGGPAPPEPHRNVQASPSPGASLDDVNLESTLSGKPAVVESVELSSTADVAEGSTDLNQLSTEEALARLTIYEPPVAEAQETVSVDGRAPPADILSAEETKPNTHTEQLHYCPECYLPLHPDPKPERLYIFLHALRYTTSLGAFETEMPEWAAEGWTWDQS